MKFKIISVDFELTRTQKIIGALAASLVGIMVCAPLAMAQVPYTFSAGQTLTAVQINANFSDLDTRVAALQSGDGVYSLGATYCGVTDPTPGDLSGLAAAGAGYVKAKAECEATCGSPTAHMCNGEELTRSAQLDQAPVEAGWYASGAYFQYTPTEGSYECFGWTSGGSTTVGALWNVTFPSGDHCSVTYPVMCCD